MSAELVTSWLDEDEALRIPDTDWGRALYAALRTLVESNAVDVVAARAEAWDEGYVARTGDTPRYLSHREWPNPYRDFPPELPGADGRP